MRSMIGAATGIVLVLGTGSAQAQQSGNAERGLELAREICSECHLVDKAAGRSTNPDAPTFETVAKTPGLTGAALTVALRTSHPTMPNIVIKEDDSRDIVAYILSLKDGN
jgi:mono/diheme cytochrome c family protein